MRRHLLNLMTAVLVLAVGAPGWGDVRAADQYIVVQSTTSTQNSGLFDHILPLFTRETGIAVRVVAVGSGQAISNAARGDGDVLLVHAEPEEIAFVEAGHGVTRHDVMYNDYVIVGPADDPAGVAGASDAVAALGAIAAFGAIAGAEAPFVSRGDDSGTHKAELRLWAAAGIDPTAASGGWYREAGAGMGATLNLATEMGAYAMTDRGTWVPFANRGDQRVLVEGDPRLFNQYGVILVNPARHPYVRAELGQAFIDWVMSARGQAAIAAFEADGRQLFFPNADPPN